MKKLAHLAHRVATEADTADVRTACLALSVEYAILRARSKVQEEIAKATQPRSVATQEEAA